MSTHDQTIDVSHSSSESGSSPAPPPPAADEVDSAPASQETARTSYTRLSDMSHRSNATVEIRGYIDAAGTRRYVGESLDSEDGGQESEGERGQESLTGTGGGGDAEDESEQGPSSQHSVYVSDLCRSSWIAISIG